MCAQEGKPLVLNVVRKAEEALVRDTSRNKEYQPIGGNPDVRAMLSCDNHWRYCAHALQLLLISVVASLMRRGSARAVLPALRPAGVRGEQRGAAAEAQRHRSVAVRHRLPAGAPH